MIQQTMKWMPMTTLTTTKLSNNSQKKIAVIITAAGSSTRMGGLKKEFLPLNDGTVLSNCAVAFLKAFKNQTPKEKPFELCDLIITLPEQAIEQGKSALYCSKDFEKLKNDLPNVNLNFVAGSNTRQKSIFNALNFLHNLPLQPEYVLIHDGARPFVNEETILQVTQSSTEFGAAAPGFTPTDTIKQIDQNGFISTHLERKSLICIQTPQAFEFAPLYKAHTDASKEENEYTDDTQIWGKFVGKVKITPGNPENLKITYPGDLEKIPPKNQKE